MQIILNSMESPIFCKGMKIASQVPNIDLWGGFYKACPVKEPSSVLSSHEELAQM